MSLCLGYLNTYIVIDSHSIENSISPNFLPVKGSDFIEEFMQ